MSSRENEQSHKKKLLTLSHSHSNKTKIFTQAGVADSPLPQLNLVPLSASTLWELYLLRETVSSKQPFPREAAFKQEDR
ncbi:hypothetical protein CDAR_584151 [Caerostris darwini]|uniref:Uncharacterized protein n=1 Tax=Caerostris darwini TaxID=1538125 RepID=A0AAV4W9C9_9ARAC|nr:hypothetical protein CDAR_584151 [Caerostris darwini]